MLWSEPLCLEGFPGSCWLSSKGDRAGMVLKATVTLSLKGTVCLVYTPRDASDMVSRCSSIRLGVVLCCTKPVPQRARDQCGDDACSRDFGLCGYASCVSERCFGGWPLCDSGAAA